MPCEERLSLHPGGLRLTEIGAIRAGVTSDSTVLDVGCGTGTSLRFLRDRFGCGVSGVELSPTAAKRARFLVPEADIREADGAELPYPTAAFDVVMLECSLSMMRAPGVALAEAERVLKPGGRLLITTLTRAQKPVGELPIATPTRAQKPVGELPIATLTGTQKPEGKPVATGGTVELSALESVLGELGFFAIEKTDYTYALSRMAADLKAAGTRPEEYCALIRTETGCEPGWPAIPVRELGYYMILAVKGSRKTEEELQRRNQMILELYRAENRFTLPERLSGHPERFLRGKSGEIVRVISEQVRERTDQCKKGEPDPGTADTILCGSSGTTGQGKRIFFTEGDLMATVDFWTEGMKPMIRSGETCVVFMPGAGRWTVGGLLSEAVSRLGGRTRVFGYPGGVGKDNLSGCPNGHLTEKSLAEAAHAAAGAACLVGLPEQLAALAEYAPRLCPRAVLFSGTSHTEAQLNRLRALWGCEIFDHWGMTETGYGGAVEGVFHDGMKVRPDIDVEIINPVSADVLPEGEWGEIVISTPKRQGMPLFRYRTGDMGRLLPGGKLDRVDRIRLRTFPKME